VAIIIRVAALADMMGMPATVGAGRLVAIPAPGKEVAIEGSNDDIFPLNTAIWYSTSVRDSDLPPGGFFCCCVDPRAFFDPAQRGFSSQFTKRTEQTMSELVDASSVKRGKVIFISGLSGSGKTTLGERFKANNYNCLHFNVDVWAFGGNPITESDQVPNPQMMAKRNPEVQAAFDNMIAHGFTTLASGQSPDFSVWEGFFSKLVPAIKDARENHPEKDLVVTFSVYLRSVRGYLRQHIENLIFIVLNPEIEHVAARKVQHLRNTAAARGQTLSQFLRSFNPDSDAPEMEENAIIEILTAQARSGAVGFEPAGDDEDRTLSICGDKTVDEVYLAASQFIATF
jgi:hypothetical protein